MGAALPREAEIAGLTASIEIDEARLARLPVLARAAELRTLVATGEERDRLSVAVTEAREAHLSARATALDLGESLLALRQARIEGMAAELAGGLAVGASCPVCGSADHPQPAVAAADAPDAVAERAAARAVDEAKADEYLRSEELRDLETRLTAVAERGSDRPPAELRDELASLDVSEHEPRRRRPGRGAGPAGDGARPPPRAAGGGCGRGGRRAGRPRRARPRQPVRQHRATAEWAREAGRALDALAAATAAEEEAREGLAEALAAAGFASRDAAAAAALPPQRLDEARAAVRDHERRRAAVAAVLEAADVDEISAAARARPRRARGRPRPGPRQARSGPRRGRAVDAAGRRVADLTARLVGRARHVAPAPRGVAAHGRAVGVLRGQVGRQPAADAALRLRPGLPALPGRRGRQRAAGPR